MTHRQPKLPPARRFIATGCVAIWLVGISACNLEALFCCDAHGGETVAHADPDHLSNPKDADAGTNHVRDGDASHSDEGDGRSHDSHQHDRKGAPCCSTLIAIVQTAAPVVFSTPDFHPLSLLCVPVETPTASLALSENSPNRPAKSCDRGFRPEVWLGPAHRSLAPPAFRLI